VALAPLCAADKGNSSPAIRPGQGRTGRQGGQGGVRQEQARVGEAGAAYAGHFPLGRGAKRCAVRAKAALARRAVQCCTTKEGWAASHPYNASPYRNLGKKKKEGRGRKGMTAAV
jgi:hypothetical protein